MGMRTRAAWVAALLMMGLPGLSSAVAVGGSLYVKAKNTRVMESPSPTANAVVILQPGEQVKWEGADAKNKQWHKVKTSTGKRGFVFQSNLSTTAPNLELVVGDQGKRKVNPEGFVSSGAAVKALSPGAVAYGNKKGGGHKQAVAQLQSLEKAAKDVSTQDIAKHAAAAGLHPVVGAETTARSGGAKSKPKGGS
ncbi:SH3 domain-containing protein [Myxococcus sp. MISCRS1]|nr:MULTISPECIES: SH3 domain-containing protein [unclassified Myxococcus]MBZ4395678.1 SH3 domain-containing protein [Myxococcus sp. AS-1-15]MBZ4411291.1 SH3 domain-containing protein [Myxococcus sp. XM-1-1-1]MCY0998963.1 SH3 domain-containing protein [Myxococcus sp. MISCRS1]BDT31035.1 SH3 domain-containing protein [Myxococcus sp. MH1]